MGTDAASRSAARLITIEALRVDAIAGGLVKALRDANVRTLLLKGASLVGLLYDDDARGYSDCDLLVAPQDFDRAEEVLSQVGYTRQPYSGQAPHAEVWHRPEDNVFVDLHRTLPHVHAPPAEAWAVLAEDAEPAHVGGADVEVLSAPARALHVVLHAVQHAEPGGRPVDELARALERLELDVWAGAAQLGERLAATEAFGAGLRLLPPGKALADRLGVPVTRSVDTLLWASSPPPGALDVERLAATAGLRRKLRLIGRELVPTQTQMRASSRMARKGRYGLAAAYVRRPLLVAAYLFRALHAWRRAKVDARGS